MREPLVIIRRESPVSDKLAKRNLRDPVSDDFLLARVQVLVGSLARVLYRHAPGDGLTLVLIRREERQQPALSKPQVEYTVHVRPVIVIVGRGDGRRDRDEMWRSGKGGLPLRHAEVRRARHRDLAVGPLLLRRPFHGVVAIALFLHKRLKRAV